MSCANRYDTLSVYDSDREDPDRLIGVYCGVAIPRTFLSTGQNMYLVLKSDGSITSRGFDFGYYFLEGLY